MKLYVNFIILTTAVSVLSVKEFSDEIFAFLPFLESIKSPPSCPTNELYKICASECSDCTHRGMCATSSCERGCDCLPRFFRVKPNGPCEPVANCPITECGENEVFRECGPVCERCTTIRCRMIGCDHKCYCKEGYLRNEEGICIPEENCPKRQHCFRNEEWADSGLVDEYCMHEEENNTNYEIQNKTECYCTEGHRRNALGYCINETLCPLLKCFGVEVYHSCVPKCNTTCRNYGNPDCEEDGNCSPGCFCPPGYVMNDFRSCILIKDCSLAIPEIKMIETNSEESESSDSETTIAVTNPDLENSETENPDNVETTEDDLKTSVGSETTEAGSNFKPTENAEESESNSDGEVEDINSTL